MILFSDIFGSCLADVNEKASGAGSRVIDFDLIPPF